ncbi:MAG TPA: hypothetical protein VMT63_13640 [Bacteroidales bacterium]|nr:hypothetical protein [Bacteroidales bacterium]
MTRYTALLLLCLLTHNLPGQSDSPAFQPILEKLFSRIRSGISNYEKLRTNDSIVNLVDRYVTSDEVFRHQLSLKFMGQVTSPDSLVKIIEWNLVLPQEHNYYFSYILHRNRKDEKPAIFRLKTPYREPIISNDSIYTQKNWYGALYYEARPFEHLGATRYLLLGIDYGNPQLTRKVIDVITFSPDSISFGCKCFSDGKTIKSRVVFEYASTAVMSLKFESGRQIVFDHLSPIMPKYQDNRQYYGPDFSFDSFIFDGGLWKYKADIDIRNK